MVLIKSKDHLKKIDKRKQTKRFNDNTYTDALDLNKFKPSCSLEKELANPTRIPNLDDGKNKQLNDY